MASDTNERSSIKQLLFTKAMPNYVIPIPTAGYKTYPCIDCGDRFIFQSSYEYHHNRKSVVITYMCRLCDQSLTFYNRCKLLSHIRSHAFRTATINVSDLKVEPLPASYFDNLEAKYAILYQDDNEPDNLPQSKPKKQSKYACLECTNEISDSPNQVFKKRAKHFMQYTNKIHTCPVCLFALPTTCALKAHMRFHTFCPPYFCPECGIQLTKRMIQYPYNHDCEGFRMMRATARFKCPLEGCYLFHPNEYKSHMKKNHIKKVYKCPMCVVACFNEITMTRHLESHQTEAKAVIYFQCAICPGRLVLQNQMDNHMRGHITNSAFVYPCWACGELFKEVRNLLQHYSNNHTQTTNSAVEGSTTTQSDNSRQNEKSNLIYRVVKRCDKCKRSFTYKCKYEQISLLPTDCPFKCTPSESSQVLGPNWATVEAQGGRHSMHANIKCNLCKKVISENWEDIKKHYASDHQNHRCLDAKLVARKLNMKKYLKKKRKEARGLKRLLKKQHRDNKKKPLSIGHTQHSSPSFSISNPLVCQKCGYEGQNRKMLEEHFVAHGDPLSAYQCMECGECFVSKPSFRIHLVLHHTISDVDEYINAKPCFNADALLVKSNFSNQRSEAETPLRENQCQICRDQFDGADDLEKHFRVHGMAFLMKNSTKMNSP